MSECKIIVPGLHTGMKTAARMKPAI